MNKKQKFVGIDGCSGGWFCIALDEDREYAGCFVGRNIAEVSQWLYEESATIALIDIPIGFSDTKKERECDECARKFIGPRYRSVFPTPRRKVIEAYYNTVGESAAKKSAAKDANMKFTINDLSKQTWAIVPKIAEVDSFLCERRDKRGVMREVHPEVCFRALNGKNLKYAKTNLGGFCERMDILNKFLSNPYEIVCNVCADLADASDVKVDDVHDALVAALTAQLGHCRGYKTLPSNPLQDSEELRMEMLYVDPQR